MEKRNYIVNLCYKYQGDYKKIEKAFLNEEEVNNYNIKEKYITIFDDAYPLAFRMLANPPWVIFYQGNIELLQR